MVRVFAAVLPKTDLISDQVRKTYCQAYIDVVRAPLAYTNEDVPFHPNAPTNILGNAYIPSDVLSKATLDDSGKYWGHRLVSCYQAEEQRDLDHPGGEGRGIYAETFSPQRMSMIYIENIIDSVTLVLQEPPSFGNNYPIKVSHVVAHEMAHVPGSGNGDEDHSEGGLMESQNLESSEPEAFSSKTIRRLRLTPSWREQ